MFGEGMYDKWYCGVVVDVEECVDVFIGDECVVVRWLLMEV